MKKGVGIGIGGVGGVFLGIGLLLGGIFIIIASVMGRVVREYDEKFEIFKQQAECDIGIVDDVGDSYTAVFYVTVDGEEYHAAFPVYSSSFQEGTEVEVYYDRDDPIDVRVPALESGVLAQLSKIFMIVGIAVAVLFGGIGLAMLISGIVVLIKLKKNTDASGASAGGQNFAAQQDAGSSGMNYSANVTFGQRQDGAAAGGSGSQGSVSLDKNNYDFGDYDPSKDPFANTPKS